jgi:hypothetical protein
MPDVIDTIRRHDPAPARPLTADEVRRADALLHSITAGAPAAMPSGSGAARPARPVVRRVRTWAITGGVAVATAAAAFGGVALVGGAPDHTTSHAPTANGSLTSAEVASWRSTATTVPVTAAVRDLAVRCLGEVGDTSIPVDAARVSVANVERRGAVTSLIATAGATGDRALCITGERGIDAELIEDRADPLPSIDGATLNVQSYGGHGDGAAALLYAYGQVGADVRRVTISLPGHPSATTSAEDGFWSMWWPNPDPSALPDLHAMRLSWTTADGAEHSGTAEDLVWDADR